MSRKLLILLVAFAIGAFCAPMAMAISIGGWAFNETYPSSGSFAGTVLNPEGKGDALIFPYYDVRILGGKSQDNYFAIINDSMTNSIDDANGGIAAKIRFREFDKSLEVYDINIWLSCYDVWVGLLQNIGGKTHLWSPDWVITDASDTAFTLFTALDVLETTGAKKGRPFRPELISIDPSRTLLGYFEVIAEEATACKASGVTGTGANKTGTVTRLGDPANRPDAPNYLQGYFFFLRVSDGVAAGYNASALANFSRTQGSLYYPPESEHPHLGDCEDTIDQVEFMLAKRFVSQGYSIESSINAKFSAIITFPTKHFHFSGPSNFSLNPNTNTYTVGLPNPARGEPFSGDSTTSIKDMNYGEEIAVLVWDRNESPFRVPPGFESPTQESDQIRLKYEVNIVGLYNTSGAVASPPPNPRDNLGLPSGGFDSGWFKIDLNGTTEGLDRGSHIKTLPDGNLSLSAFNWFGDLFRTYHGLPALGLIYQEFFNGAVGAAYGEMLPIFYEVDWRDPVL